MTKTAKAIYEDGVLRPIEPLEGIAEHCKVTVTIEVGEKASHSLADCIGGLPDEDADAMRRAVAKGFKQSHLL